MTAHRIKVLLIEDNPSDVTLIRDTLANGSNSRFDLESTDRLAAGLERLDSGGIDVAIVALGLPDYQGLETFRQTQARAPQMPIVVLGEPGDEPLAQQAVSEGAQDFLVKNPGENGVLAQSLCNAIARKQEEETLRESERRYKQLLSAVTDYIFTVTIENGVPTSTVHGPGCSAVTGYMPAEFRTDNYLWFLMIHVEDRVAVLSQNARLLAGEDPPPLEHRIVHKCGDIRWIRNTTVAHRNRQGVLTSFDGLINNITAHKRAEEALVLSEERYRLLFERNLAGILISTLEGDILDANDSLARMLGYSSSSELLRLHTQDFYYRRIERKSLMARLQKDRMLTNEEVCLRDKKGNPVWVLANATLSNGDLGTPFVYGTFVDIAERRKAEQAVKDSEALYHSLVENIPLHMFRKDIEGRFTFANKRFCDALAKPLAEILGKTDADFFPGELADKYHRDDLRVMATGEVYETTEAYQSVVNGRSYVAVIKTPVYSSQQEIVGIQGIFWDVTERKWAEEQKEQINIARAIHQKLLPRTAPKVEGFDIGAYSCSAAATGGDFFDYIGMLDHTLGIVIADVSGHGYGPALVAAATRACLRSLATMIHGSAIEHILSTANRLLFDDTEGEPYVTLIFAHLEPAARTFTYSNAGHPWGYVFDSAGEVKQHLLSTGSLLGIFPDSDFPTAPPIKLEAGDLVLLITDGILEAMSPQELFFGKDRLLEMVRAHRHENATAIVTKLCQAAHDFYGGEPQRDDVTAIVIKVT